MSLRHRALRVSPLLAVLVVPILPRASFASDYVPFLPDTTAFSAPFVGQVHQFVSPGQCLEVTEGNLEDEDIFLGMYAQDMLVDHMIQRLIDAWSGPGVQPQDRVAAAAAGWSFPRTLTITFALVDSAGGQIVIQPFTETFEDPLPDFPDSDPQDTTAVQQVTLFVQFRADAGKSMQRSGSTGMIAETATDPEERRAGTSTIDIFEVSDKWMEPQSLAIDLLFRIANSGTGGAIGYQFHATSLVSESEVLPALSEARYALRDQWERLRHAVQMNANTILETALADPPQKTPCGAAGGLQVFVHDEGTTCDEATNPDCVIYGDGHTLGLPLPTAIAITNMVARTAPGEIRVSWRAPDGSRARFDVYRAETARPEIEKRLTPQSLMGGPEFEYVDREVEAGVEYAYTITSIDPDGTVGRFGPIVATAAPIVRLTLAQNAPNPFRPSTMIRFEVPAAGGRTVLRVYDASGRKVRTLLDAPLAPGSYQVRWDGRDDQGRTMPAGVYVYAFDGDRASGRKMILQK